MNALLIDERDNVAVVTAPVEKGEEVTYFCEKQLHRLTAEEKIPIYHKIAVRRIKKREKIIKYGCVIGVATEEIGAGEHVHCHNAASDAKKGERE